MFFMDPDKIMDVLNPILSHQVTQFGVAFSIAAWIHASTVKKEIARQMGYVTTAINDVSAALRQDLATQDKRLTGVESGIKILATRVENLENEKKGLADD